MRPDKHILSRSGARRVSRGAFSLIEMLVVIAIIASLLVVTAVGVGAMTRDNWLSAGQNTVNVATTAIRAYSTRSIGNLLPGSVGANYPGGNYSGSALIFCPSGEIRLVENNQKATVPGPASPDPVAADYIEGAGLNAYEDISGREYVSMPKAAGVLGVVRSGGSLYFLTPPFAIRFNQDGQLIPGDPATPDANQVFYDGDCDGGITVGDTRTNAYNVRDWDATIGGSQAILDSNKKRYRLGFERFETVVAVLIYDKRGFYAAFPGAIPEQINPTSPMGHWLLGDRDNDGTYEDVDANGNPRSSRLVHFSRYTGAMMRELRP